MTSLLLAEDRNEIIKYKIMYLSLFKRGRLSQCSKVISNNIP